MTSAVNGTDGLSLFPVTDTISYVARDNARCCESMPRSTQAFDVFVIHGRPATLTSFTTSFFVCTASSYAEACDKIEDSIEKVYRVNSVIQGEP